MSRPFAFLPLVFLAGCFDSDAMRLHWTVDFKHRLVYVENLAMNVHEGGDDRCATAAACVDALKEHLADARKSAREAGGQDIVVGYTLHDGVLDEWGRYSVPFDAPSWAEASSPLRLATVDRHGRRARTAVLVVRDPATADQTTWTVTGEKVHVVPAPGATTPQESWVLTRGRPEIVVDYRTTSDDGKVVHTPAWVPTIAGLAEALAASGLLEEAGVRE